MSNNNSAERSSPSPVVDFRPKRLAKGEIPVRPEPSSEHAAQAYDESVGKPGEFFNPLIDWSVKAADSARLGWVVKAPVTVDVHIADKDAELHDPVDIRPYGGLEVQDVIHDGPSCPDVFGIDTHWEVRTPEELIMISYPLLTHLPDRVSGIPTLISDVGDDNFVPLVPRIQVERGKKVRIERAQPLTQLVLTEPPAPTVPTREATAEENTVIEKHEKAERLHPDWYESNRTENRE